MQETAVKSVARIAALLRILAKHGPLGASLTDIAADSGFGKATSHRLLTALVEVGFAYQDLATRHYRLGASATALGEAARAQNSAAWAERALARLAQATGDTVFASVAEGTGAVCVARAVGSYPIRTLTLDVGDRRPLGVGAGSLALLAAHPDPEIEAIIGRNREWLQDFQGFSADALRALVARTRADGYAFNEGRIVPAMAAAAVAVRDASGRPLMALSIAAIRDRLAADRLPGIVDLLRQEAQALEAMLNVSAAE